MANLRTNNLFGESGKDPNGSALFDGSGHLDFITIATTGNAQDFGECSQPSGWGYIANTTDSHGGLGGF